MPNSTKPEPYRWLAEYYDEIFGVYRAQFHNPRMKILGRILPRERSVCDLAGGTGETALDFARRGIDTYAVDLSPTMCRVACQKAEQERLPIQVLQADMRCFRLAHPVDLITREADALNHVALRSNLRRVARAASRALRPGGYFLCDVNNARGFKRYWTGNVGIEKPAVMLVMRNDHAGNALRARIDVERFIRERGLGKDGHLWRRHHERVEEVCWRREEIQHAMRDAGFDRLRSWDAKPFLGANPLVTRRCHTFYLAQKSQCEAGY
jgi:SAM-dependent methyltransferase